MVLPLYPIEDRDDWREALLRALAQREALSLDELCLWTGTAPASLLPRLAELVAAGEVEELRPVAAWEADRHWFYRRRRTSDNDFQWHRGLFESVRPRQVSVVRVERILNEEKRTW